VSGSDTDTEPCWSCGAATEEAAELRPASYRRCLACGLLFQPRRDSADLHALYDGEYFQCYPCGGDYSAGTLQREHEARVRVRLLCRFVETPGCLLEVGAAGGHFLAAAGQAGFHAFGIEPVAELAERGRSELGVEIAAGLLEEVDLDNDTFEAACAFHVLEHLPSPGEALGLLREALVPRGILLVEVPNIESFAAQRASGEWPPLDPLHHVTHYGPAALRGMLERAGFDVIRIETVPFFTYLRPREAVRPHHLAHRVALSARARVPLLGPHPHRHELLRAAARPAR